jgi:hypothetical protein
MPRIRDVEPVSVRLRRCRIFAGLGDDALEALAGGVRRRRYERGQADLAAIVGGSRQGTSRALRELADAGLLVVDRNRLQIPDLQRLARRGET